MSLAAKGIKIDADVEIVVAAVSSQLDGVFTFKEQRPAIKAFLRSEHVFALLLTGLGNSLDKYCGASYLSRTSVAVYIQTVSHHAHHG